MAEAICLILDVGASASRQIPIQNGGQNGLQNGAQDNSKSFLQASLECASLFVERKLFKETKDVLGLVQFGTTDTQNPLDYENIKVLDRGFCQADWELISYLREHVQGTDVESDWLSAMIVGLDAIKTAADGGKFQALKIVLFSDLGGESNLSDLDHVVKAMRLIDNVDFTFIGPDDLILTEDDNFDEPKKELDEQVKEEGNVSGDEQDEPKPGPSRQTPKKRSHHTARKPLTKAQEENYAKISELIAITEGIECSIDEAVAQFFYKNKKGKKPFPWKVMFEIGPDIKISTTGYVKMRREPPKSWKRCLATGASSGVGQDSQPVPGTSGQQVQELKAVSTMIRNNEDQETVDIENTYSSFRYGNEMVKMDEADEATMKLATGPKSMSLFGFINRSEIQMNDLMGNGSMVFLPSDDDENSERALSVLTEAMLAEEVVAIVRRVYRMNSSPHLGVLAPEFDEDGQLYLVYSELPFEEERRELQFQSIYKKDYTEEQTGAIDHLIHSMDLDVMSDFDPESQLNPQYQYLFQSLIHRATSSTSSENLPEFPQRIMNNLLPEEHLLAAAEPIMQQIRQLFPTEQVEVKGKRTADKVFGEDEAEETEVPDSKRQKTNGDSNLIENGDDDEERLILTVGSVRPVQDFQYLLSHPQTTGADIQSAGSQMEEIIDRFLASAFGTDLNNKIIQCLKAYRDACKSRDRADLYNNFIRLVKTKAGERLWSDIKEQQATTGLIRKSEVDSGVVDTEADQLFEDANDTNTDNQQDNEDEGDIEDLL